MDPLQKLVRDRLRTKVPLEHPNAEVLSAFAENALPATEHDAVVEHLSACAHCRDLLFLAAPPASEPQQVFAAPKARPYFALRWGTLVACLVIGAVVLVSRHRSMQPMVGFTSAKSQSTQVPQNLAVQEKLPAELESMRDKQLALRVLPLPASPPPRGHAEPKASTAEPRASMAFDDSGEISVSRGANWDGSPLRERAVVNGLPKAAPEAGASFGTIGGPIGNGASAGRVAQTPGASSPENPAWKAENRPAFPQDALSTVGLAKADASKDKLFFHGNVEGTVYDLTGAAVPHAKITATGPLGEKTALSDDSGKFSFDTLAAGTYQVRVDATGFRQALTQVAVLSDKQATADFRLQPGATTETIEIEAAAALIATPSAANRVVASDAQVANSDQASGSRAQTTTETKQKAALWHETNALAKVPVGQQFSLSTQGSVQRSNDGGKTWVPLAVAEGTVFRAVAFDGNQVWAAGNAGLLYHSLDGGEHWTRVTPLSDGEKIQADITEIQFPDPDHVVLRSATGQRWASTDGGKTWVASNATR